MLWGIAHNIPTVYDVLAARISKCVAFAGRISKPQVCSPAKMWVEGGVGMFANEVSARSETRAVAEAELPNGAASPA
jgi:hypothetical protein